jgi:hypothetical protein
METEVSVKLKTALYLDDLRTPTTTIPGYEPWIVARNFDEFTKHIADHGIPDLISFDHDLHKEHYAPMEYWNGDYMIWAEQQNFKHKTGLQCAQWLCEVIKANPGLQLKNCSVHSANATGAWYIQNCINSFKKHMGWLADCWIGTHPFTE